ncbi:MAG: hypothetical protein HYW47_06410 [Deltaproteobacteria bacterium]|nr:hypothetical protein [Deltaproteobacteria bacterium]
MKYSAIIVIEKLSIQRLEEKIAFLSDFFDEIILVCEDLVSLSHLKPLCVKPFQFFSFSSRASVIANECEAIPSQSDEVATVSCRKPRDDKIPRFLNFLHGGLFVSQNEWCFVCENEEKLDLSEIKKMKGYLSKSQVVLLNKNLKQGFYRKHSLKKIQEFLKAGKGIEEFLKSVRTKILY